MKVLSVNEDDSIGVFYGDYGDSCSVSPDDLKCIPDWALTKLPFQVKDFIPLNIPLAY